MYNDLLTNINKLHTTHMGVGRIKKNLQIDVDDIVAYCKDKILDSSAIIERRDKNWYVLVEGCKLTINAHSYTIITAHREKGKAIL